MSEVERLRAYHPFDDDVLERISEVAGEQRTASWQSIASSLPDKQVFRPETGKPIEVLDIRPSDHQHTQIYYLPMGNTLDPSMSLRVATMAAAQPDTRVIAVSNPGAPGLGKGKIGFADFNKIWKAYDTKPLVEPVFRYLAKQGIDKTTQVGYSYGADKAAIACHYAYDYEHAIVQGVFMEPTGIKERTLIELGKDFNSTAGPLDAYIKATDSQAYFEARRQADKLGYGLPGYALGLSRLTNVAIAHALTYEDFWNNVDTALEIQRGMTASILWGTNSELADHDIMTKETFSLARRHGARGARVRATMLEGQKHAMGDDIFLHAAMVLQSTKQAS